MPIEDPQPPNPVKPDLGALLTRYDRGELDRRQLLTLLAATVAAGSATGSNAQSSTFEATGLHHLALEVTDVARSTAFYRRHLGLQPTSQSRNSAFLDCGPHFVALFRGSEPGLAHFSFGIDPYSQSEAAERLRAVGLEPKLRGQRIYFDDPDGIEVQLSQS